MEKQTIRAFGSQLKERGVTGITYSDSSTSFGNSSYLFVGPFKVRFSDHGVTSTSRILNELHLCLFTWEMHLNEIEYYFFPERFEKRVNIEYGDPYEYPADKLQNIAQDYQVLNPCIRITKKGRTMASIRVKGKRVEKLVKKVA